MNVISYFSTFTQKQKMRFTAIILFLNFCFLGQAQNMNDQYLNDYLVKWGHSKTYMISLIKAMPEDKMTYKPTESAQSFRDLTIHIVSNMVWLSTDYLEGGGFETEYKNKDLTKAELIQVVEKAFDYSYTAVKNYNRDKLVEEQSFFAGPMTGHQILRLMNDHCTHHKGQLTLYLKMNEIAVPRYVGW